MRYPVAFSTVFLLLMLLLGGCNSNAINPNYVPIVGAFGQVSRIDGQAALDRSSTWHNLGVGSHIFIGDTLVTKQGARVEIALVSGQTITLLPNARWTLVSAVTNGAAYGSRTRLSGGALHMNGDRHQPHQMMVDIPSGEVTTLSEHFLLDVGDAPTSPGSAVALDSTPIIVSNEHGTVTLDGRWQSAMVPMSGSPYKGPGWTQERLLGVMQPR